MYSANISLSDVLNSYVQHVQGLYISYCMLAKDWGDVQGDAVNTVDGRNDRFITDYLGAFKQGVIDADEFTSYVGQYVLNTADTQELEKAFNVITMKLMELRNTLKRLKHNTRHGHHTSIYNSGNVKAILFLIDLGHEKDDNGNLRGNDGWFYSDELFDKIHMVLEETTAKINQLFSLKKLNQATPTVENSSQTTPAQKEINPVTWNNEIKELAYIFWKLKKETIIDADNLGLTLSKVFINKEKEEQKNVMFNKHFSDFENGNSFPKKAKKIDAFIQTLLIKKSS